MAPDTTPQPRSRSNNPGKQATLNDVCQAAGVSKATVSRVLNNKPGVGKKVRSRVLAMMKKLNYTPRAAARNLSLAKSDSIGIVFQDLTSGWLLNIFRGIMQVTTGTGYNVLTALSITEGDEAALPNRLMAEGRIDGLVWLDPRVPEETIVEMSKRPMPFVVLQRSLKSSHINTVSIENTQGAYDMVKHLLSLGHQSFLLVTGQEENQDSQQRLLGTRQALQDHQIAIPRERILNGHNVGSHAVTAMKEYLEAGHDLPDAIIAFNDDMAIAIMHWLRAQGYRVPEDVAITGYDGINEAEYVGLTTIDTPMYEMGVLATQNLIGLIEGINPSAKPKQVLLRGNLNVRTSCGAGLKKKH